MATNLSSDHQVDINGLDNHNETQILQFGNVNEKIPGQLSNLLNNDGAE